MKKPKQVNSNYKISAPVPVPRFLILLSLLVGMGLSYPAWSFGKYCRANWSNWFPTHVKITLEEQRKRGWDFELEYKKQKAQVVKKITEEGKIVIAMFPGEKYLTGDIEDIERFDWRFRSYPEKYHLTVVFDGKNENDTVYQEEFDICVTKETYDKINKDSWVTFFVESKRPLRYQREASEIIMSEDGGSYRHERYEYSLESSKIYSWIPDPGYPIEFREQTKNVGTGLLRIWNGGKK